MSYSIELDGDMIDKLVCQIITDHRSYLLDDLNKVIKSTKGYVFSADKNEDIALITAHLDAFTKVMGYFGKR